MFDCVVQIFIYFNETVNINYLTLLLEIKKEVQPQMKVMHAYESQIAEFRNTMIELASEVHAQTSEIHKLKEERSTLSKYSKNLMDSLTENIEMMKAH